jgi:hypothetical protein
MVLSCLRAGSVLHDVTDTLSFDSTAQTLAAGNLQCDDWAAQVTARGAAAFRMAQQPEAAPSSVRWQPPDGSAVSAAAVCGGVVLVHCTGRGGNRLTLLRLCNAAAGAAPPQLQLRALASVALPHEASCISNVLETGAGGVQFAVGTYAPSLLLLTATGLDLDQHAAAAGAPPPPAPAPALSLLGELPLDDGTPFSQAQRGGGGGPAPASPLGSPLAAVRAGLGLGGAPLPEGILLTSWRPGGAAEALVSLRTGEVQLVQVLVPHAAEAHAGRSTPQLQLAACPRGVRLGALPPALVPLPDLGRAAPGFAAAAVSDRVFLVRPRSESASVDALPLSLCGVMQAAALVLPAAGGAAAAPAGGLSLYLLCCTAEGRLQLVSLEAHRMPRSHALPLSVDDGALQPAVLATSLAVPGQVVVAGRVCPLRDGDTMADFNSDNEEDPPFVSVLAPASGSTLAQTAAAGLPLPCGGDAGDGVTAALLLPGSASPRRFSGVVVVGTADRYPSGEDPLGETDLAQRRGRLLVLGVAPGGAGAGAPKPRTAELVVLHQLHFPSPVSALCVTPGRPDEDEEGGRQTPKCPRVVAAVGCRLVSFMELAHGKLAQTAWVRTNRPARSIEVRRPCPTRRPALRRLWAPLAPDLRAASLTRATSALLRRFSVDAGYQREHCGVRRQGRRGRVSPRHLRRRPLL